METEYSEQNRRFISHLEKILGDKGDRGDRAGLRRWWSASTRGYAFPVLGRLGALDEWNATNPRLLVAALFAEHPQHNPKMRGIGATCLEFGRKADGERVYEAHFRRLLSCESLDDLGEQLHRAVRRAAREPVGVNYEELLSNLRQWRNNRQRVKTRWAMQFWQAEPAETEGATTA